MSTAVGFCLAKCRKIFLYGLTVEASIGFHDFETRQRQRVVIDIEVFVLNAPSTPALDTPEEVFDYDFLRDGVKRLAAERHYNLQETFLDRIVELCLVHPEIKAVRASTEKPDVYPDCRTVGIEVFRFRL